jgi:hypothetical protein
VRPLAAVIRLMSDEIRIELPPLSGDHSETQVWCPQGCGQSLKFRQLVATRLGKACPFCAKIIGPPEDKR